MADEKGRGGNELYEAHRFKYGVGIFMCMLIVLASVTYSIATALIARQFADGRDTMCDATLKKIEKCGGVKYGCLVVRYKAQGNQSTTIESENVMKIGPNSTIALRLEGCRPPLCTPQIRCRISTSGGVKHNWIYPKGRLIFSAAAAAVFSVLSIFLIYRCLMYKPFLLPGGYI